MSLYEIEAEDRYKATILHRPNMHFLVIIDGLIIEFEASFGRAFSFVDFWLADVAPPSRRVYLSHKRKTSIKNLKIKVAM